MGGGHSSGRADPDRQVFQQVGAWSIALHLADGAARDFLPTRSGSDPWCRGEGLTSLWCQFDASINREEPTMRKAPVSAAVVAVSALTVALSALPATAQSVPSGCGTTIFTSCSETDHYSQIYQWLGDDAAPSTCPAYFSEWALATGPTNAVQHVTFNKDGDGRFTSTWTGDDTIAFYPAGSVTIVTDQDGNVISADIHGPADQVLTGHLTEWDGGSFNNQSSVVGFTFGFEGSDQAGNPIKVHGASHGNWIPGSDPAGPPSNGHTSMTCG